MDDDGDTPTYGHLLTVEVEAIGACALTVPYPLVDGEPWRELELLTTPGANASLVTTERGPGLRVAGAGNFTVVGRASTTEPLDAVDLSLSVGGWQSFEGGLRNVFEVETTACTNGTTLTENWLRDLPGAIETIGIQGQVDDLNWTIMPGVRSLTQ